MTCGVLLAAHQQTTGGYRSPARVMAGGAPARHPEIYTPYSESAPTRPPQRSRIQRRPRLPALNVTICNLRITFHRYLQGINQ
ncbi:hypothetical protein Y032_0016g2975 [Ancylostoma ceylanicum]|uniref:Uncharacterized protein n=1 Tax=Ancylostoma ceylanicum TaxID=53326 RepID=A0A016V724_9BILA|nr:hypothetical protein Y032_0016g2975 [Ancylostoma ceylanicum]